MSKISSYQNKGVVAGADQWIGTDSANSQTKNFTPEALSSFLNTENKNEAQTLRYYYNDWKVAETRTSGSISFATPSSGVSVAFSSINSFIISDYQKGRLQNMGSFYEVPLIGADVLITNASDISQWAIYKWDTAIVNVDDAEFYDVGLTFLSGSGNLVENEDYLMSVLQTAAASGDIASVSATAPLNGGGISGDLTIGIDQADTTTDGYLSSADWNTFNSKGDGDITEVNVTAPLSGGATTGAASITITQSDTTTDGYLSSTDWNTFNNKGDGDITGVIVTTPLVGGALSGDANISLPEADTATDGYLSATDWNTFNNKGDGDITGVIVTTPLVGGALSGDASISLSEADTATDGYLSATDWNTFNNKGDGDITGVTVTAPLLGGALSGDASITIAQADTSTDGYISSTDWNTFNGKGSGDITDVEAGGGLTGGGSSGDVSLSVTGVSGVNNQTAAYTLVLADAGKIVRVSNASAINVTIPTNSTAFEIGDSVIVAQAGAGQITFVGASGGVVINSFDSKIKTVGQHAKAVLIKVGTNTWELGGEIEA